MLSLLSFRLIEKKSNKEKIKALWMLFVFYARLTHAIQAVILEGGIVRGAQK
jgi:hypothetical protein